MSKEPVCIWVTMCLLSTYLFVWCLPLNWNWFCDSKWPSLLVHWWIPNILYNCQNFHYKLFCDVIDYLITNYELQVIKQTIMTTVYGVTRFGAANQIGGQLRHIDEFPKHLVFPAMIYLTDKTFESLQQMFTSTKEIQVWL